MLTFSFFGEPVVIILLGLFAFLLAHQNHHPFVERTLFYAGIAYGLNILLKLVLHRQRPHGRIIKTLGIQSYSFPSGHAFGTVVLYGLLSYLAFKRIGGSSEVLLGVILIGLIFITGVSRVYLGTHYPSDVVAGWLLGFISLIIVIGLA